jgi:ankyrin repeat protein
VAAERDDLANKVVEWEKKFVLMQQQQEMLAAQLQAQARAEADLQVAHARAESERQLSLQKVETERKIKAEVEDRLKDEIETRIKAELEAKMRVDYETAIKAEYEAKLQAELQRAKLEVEAETKAKAVAHAMLSQEVKTRSRSGSAADSEIRNSVGKDDNLMNRPKAPSIDLAEYRSLCEELERTKRELSSTKEIVADERRKSVLMRPPEWLSTIGSVVTEDATSLSSMAPNVEAFMAKIAALEEQNRLLQIGRQNVPARDGVESLGNGAECIATTNEQHIKGKRGELTVADDSLLDAGPDKAATVLKVQTKTPPNNLLRIPSSVGMVQASPRGNILDPSKLPRSSRLKSMGGDKASQSPAFFSAFSADIQDSQNSASHLDCEILLPHTREKRRDSTVEFQFSEVYTEPVDEANVLDASSEDEDSDDDVVGGDSEEDSNLSEVPIFSPESNLLIPRVHPRSEDIGANALVSLESIDQVYGERFESSSSPGAVLPEVNFIGSDSDDETTVYKTRSPEEDDCSTSIDSDDEDEEEAITENESEEADLVGDEFVRHHTHEDDADSDNENEDLKIVSSAVQSNPADDGAVCSSLPRTDGARPDPVHRRSDGRLNAAADIALESAKLMQKRTSSLARIFASSPRGRSEQNADQEDDEELDENADEVQVVDDESFDNLVASAEKLIGKSVSADSSGDNRSDQSNTETNVDSGGDPVFHTSPALRRISSMFGQTSSINDERDLFDAIIKRDYESVERMLSATPKLVRITTAANRAPLHIACVQDDVAMMELLLYHNADIQAVDDRNRTCVHMCRSLAALALCCKENAPLSVPDRDGLYPVHIFAREGLAPLLKSLLDAGVDPMVTEPVHRRTCLHIAAVQGDFDVLSTILFCSKQKLNIDCLDANGLAVSHLVASSTNPNGQQQRSLMLLLDKGASVTCRTSRRATILHFICCNQFLCHSQIAEPLVQMLLEMSSEVLINSVDAENCTLVLLAAALHEWSLCKLLLESGADLNISCSITSSLLQQAMGHGSALDGMGTEKGAGGAAGSGTAISLLSQADIVANDLIPRQYRPSLFSTISVPQTKIPTDCRGRCMQCSVTFEKDASGSGAASNSGSSGSSFGFVGSMFQSKPSSRRNHCRLCNRVVCKDCIVKEMPRNKMPSFIQDSCKESAMKVCTVCYEIVMAST